MLWDKTVDPVGSATICRDARRARHSDPGTDEQRAVKIRTIGKPIEQSSKARSRNSDWFSPISPQNQLDAVNSSGNTRVLVRCRGAHLQAAGRPWSTAP